LVVEIPGLLRRRDGASLTCRSARHNDKVDGLVHRTRIRSRRENHPSCLTVDRNDCGLRGYARWQVLRDNLNVALGTLATGYDDLGRRGHAGAKSDAVRSNDRLYRWLGWSRLHSIDVIVAALSCCVLYSEHIGLGCVECGCRPIFA